MDKIYFSKEGLEAQQERIRLQNENVKATGKRLEDEVDGDSSVWHDNFGFEQGQRELEMESKKLKDLTVAVSRAQVVEVTEQTKRVAIGNTVRLEMEDGSTKEITIGAYGESLPKKGLITYQAPLARAIIGKEEGDEAIISLPKGVQEVFIEEVLPASYKYRLLVQEALANLRSSEG